MSCVIALAAVLPVAAGLFSSASQACSPSHPSGILRSRVVAFGHPRQGEGALAASPPVQILPSVDWPVEAWPDEKLGKDVSLPSVEWPVEAWPDAPPDSWDDRFELLCRYHEENGDCLVPHLFVADDGTNLGTWVTSQRRLRKTGELDAGKFEQLEGLGFAWSAAEVAWEQNFQALEAFRSEVGHCLVPRAFVSLDGRKLGAWVNTQRLRFKTGEMMAGQARRLEDAGFEWDASAAAWDRSFAALEAFRQEVGHCRVPATFAVASDGFKLGSWVARQRRAFKKGTLGAFKKGKLEDAGFEWALPSRKKT